MEVRIGIPVLAALVQQNLLRDILPLIISHVNKKLTMTIIHMHAAHHDRILYSRFRLCWTHLTLVSCNVSRHAQEACERRLNDSPQFQQLKRLLACKSKQVMARNFNRCDTARRERPLLTVPRSCHRTKACLVAARLKYHLDSFTKRSS